MKIFINYASDDQEIAFRLAADLEAQGFQCWLDKKELRPGANWKLDIRKAIREGSFFLALLSSRSLRKRGFVQQEIAIALDEMRNVPPSDIFFVPVRIDECTPDHPAIEERQWVDLFPSYERGLAALIRLFSGGPSQLVRSRPGAAPRQTTPQLIPELSSRSGAKVEARKRWWTLIWEQKIPVPAVAFIQFIVAVFALNIYNSSWAFKFGTPIPLWSSLPSMAIGRIFRGRRFVASGFGLLAGLAIGGGLMFFIIEDESWIGAIIGAALVGLLSGFWAEPRREMRIVVALFWTALFAGCIGSFNPVNYSYLGGLDLFLTGAAIVWWGFLLIATYYFLGLLGVRDSVLCWIYQQDEAQQTSPSRSKSKNQGRAKRKARG